MVPASALPGITGILVNVANSARTIAPEMGFAITESANVILRGTETIVQFPFVAKGKLKTSVTTVQ